MKKSVRKAIAVLLSVLGVLLAVYFGGYWLLFVPLRELYAAFTQGTLTSSLLLSAVVRVFFSTTAAGIVWVLFDILAGFFRDDIPKDDF